MQSQTAHYHAHMILHMRLEQTAERLSPRSVHQIKNRTPEPFSGMGSFSDWVDHFEGVAAINDWDDAAKLLWMRVRLVGRAQTTYGRLPDVKKRGLSDVEEVSKREV